jgi:tRNA C32,U32 (ribose-2'-O)-methylase TrmJ
LRWQRQRLGQLATNAEVEALLQRAAVLLERSGVGAEETSGGGDKGNHRRKRLPAGHLRALLLRSQATVAEVRALHGMLKEVERADGGLV